jgi:hypothetical protein
MDVLSYRKAAKNFNSEGKCCDGIQKNCIFAPLKGYKSIHEGTLKSSFLLLIFWGKALYL